MVIALAVRIAGKNAQVITVITNFNRLQEPNFHLDCFVAVVQFQ